MGTRKASCPNCERLARRVAELERQFTKAMQRIGQLEEQLAKAQKNSSTSSKPPSSDIVKPNKSVGKKGSNRRKAGGQPGHARHDRKPFFPEEIDQTYEYSLDACPDCGHALQGSQKPAYIIQQVEIIKMPIVVTEHRALGHWCPSCRKVHQAPMPENVKQTGLVGPRLTTLVAYLKSACHMSFSSIRKFLRDVVNVTISRGQLAKLIGKVSQSLAASYEELKARLPSESWLNVDETGHKDRGKKYWTWCFRAELYTLFKIDKSRSSDVLIDVLGREFTGVLGCDYFGAYRKFMREFDVAVQFCLAHLIRDVKFLMTLSDRKTQNYGRRLREALRSLFAVIHGRDQWTAKIFQRKLEIARQTVLSTATRRVPETKSAQNLAKRFRKHGNAYFQFITTPGIEPTNNLAEQAIRFVVIDRRITQGTRSAAGRTWCGYIWTAIATCTQQDRSVFEFLHETVLASINGQPPPSLLPDTS